MKYTTIYYNSLNTSPCNCRGFFYFCGNKLHLTDIENRAQYLVQINDFFIVGGGSCGIIKYATYIDRATYTTILIKEVAG